jgi:hypothetical protein
MFFQEGQERGELPLHDPRENHDTPVVQFVDENLHEVNQKKRSEVRGDDVERAFRLFDPAFPDLDSCCDTVRGEIFPRFPAGGAVDIDRGHMTRSQPVRCDGKDPRARPHIQDGFSSPLELLERKEASFRGAVPAGSECSFGIQENRFPVFTGIREGKPLSGDQDRIADGPGFPEPEGAWLSPVLDERFDTFRGEIKDGHDERMGAPGERGRGTQNIPCRSFPNFACDSSNQTPFFRTVS